MTSTSIFACRDARSTHWQLGPLPPITGRMTLIGWRQVPEPRDAGVPEEVAGVLTRALTSVARVTFPCSVVNPPVTTVWAPLGDDLTRVLTCKGFIGRIAAGLRGISPDIVLLSTRRPEISMRMFEDAGYPWWLQGQVVLLSETDASPPDIDRETLLALFGENWARQAVLLGGVGIGGILRPGVDGDVAGFLALTDRCEQVLINMLESKTRLAGFDWALLTETAFALQWDSKEVAPTVGVKATWKR